MANFLWALLAQEGAKQMHFDLSESCASASCSGYLVGACDMLSQPVQCSETLHLVKLFKSYIIISNFYNFYTLSIIYYYLVHFRMISFFATNPLQKKS